MKDTQRNREVWSIHRKKKKKQSNVTEEAKTLVLIDKDFKSGIISMFKN